MTNETMISMLKKKIGQNVSENFSPTCRAKLVSVGHKYATFEVTKSPWTFDGVEHEGKLYKRPIPYAWNAFFF